MTASAHTVGRPGARASRPPAGIARLTCTIGTTSDPGALAKLTRAIMDVTREASTMAEPTVARATIAQPGRRGACCA